MSSPRIAAAEQRALAAKLGKETKQEEEAPPVRALGEAYRGAERRRQWKGWMPDHRSGDTAIGDHWPLLQARIRDLCRNEPVMRSLKRAIAKHTIGAGIAMHADVRKLNSDETDDLVNFEFDDQFEAWAEDEFDVEGKFAWPQGQWQHFGEVMESGEGFLLECWDDASDRAHPLCYQLIEAEQIDDTKDWAAGSGPGRENKCVRGIEYDGRGKPVAYWIYEAHPYDRYSSFTTKSSRVPQERVIHSYFPNRPSENRGVSWFAANVQSTKDLDWYLGNELTAGALAALLTLIVKRKHQTGSGLGLAGNAASTEGDSDDWGNALVKWGRGVVAEIGPDDDVKIAESNRPNRDAAPFVKLIMLLNGMAAGVSFLRTTGDYSQSSYTSARGAHLDDQAFFTVVQQWQIRAFIRKVRRRHTLVSAGLGLYRSVSPRQLLRDRANYLRTIAQPPGREQLDPAKETTPAMQRIDGMLSTWQDECGARGKNWRRVALQQKRERDFFAALGLTPNLTGGSPPAEPQPASEDEEADRAAA